MEEETASIERLIEFCAPELCAPRRLIKQIQFRSFQISNFPKFFSNYFLNPKLNFFSCDNQFERIISKDKFLGYKICNKK
jgi:hypothetical protein